MEAVFAVDSMLPRRLDSHGAELPESKLGRPHVAHNICKALDIEPDTHVEEIRAALAVHAAVSATGLDVELILRSLKWASWSWADSRAYPEPKMTTDEYDVVTRAFGYEPWAVQS